MKEVLNLLSFIINFYRFIYSSCFVMFYKNCIFKRFSFKYMRKKSKSWLVNFPTFIAVTIHILLGLREKYFD